MARNTKDHGQGFSALSQMLTPEVGGSHKQTEEHREQAEELG